MALIKCNECGKEISDKAIKCVHCGKKVISKEQYIEKQEKIHRRKKERKVIKKFILVFLSITGLLIIYIILGLLLPIKSIDFTTKYKSYLDYALGDNWTITNIEKNKGFKNFWFHEYLYWTISYKDNNNKSHLLKIDNYNLINCSKEDICSDYVFSSSIIYYYRFILNDILSKGHISELDDHINIIDLYNPNTNIYAKDTLKLIDEKNGLDFKDISIDKLDNKYYYLELSVLYDSGNDINNYTTNESKKIIEALNIKNAIISAGDVEKNLGSTVPIYCIKDSKTIKCPAETELDSMNNAIMNKDNYITVK